MGRPSRSIDDHFVDITITGAWWCWRLPHRSTADGYVRITSNYKQLFAHRAIYEHLVGPIPRGLTLDHLCRNRWCCNPNHVEPVTQKENTLRGNGPAARNSRKLRCKRGHALQGDNLYLNKSDDSSHRRVCMMCNRYLKRRWRADRRRKGLMVT